MLTRPSLLGHDAPNAIEHAALGRKTPKIVDGATKLVLVGHIFRAAQTFDRERPTRDALLVVGSRVDAAIDSLDGGGEARDVVAKPRIGLASERRHEAPELLSQSRVLGPREGDLA